MNNKDTYEVGFGKPPKQHQFKPRQSGNPRGRPKGAKNLNTELKEILTRQVEIKIDGTKRKMSTRAIVFQKQVERAFKGDHRAARLVLETALRHANDEKLEADVQELAREDLEILDQFLNRDQPPISDSDNPSANLTKEQDNEHLR